MLHLSQWTSQFVQNINMTIRHPLSLDPHIVQGKTSKGTPQTPSPGLMINDYGFILFRDPDGNPGDKRGPSLSPSSFLRFSLVC